MGKEETRGVVSLSKISRSSSARDMNERGLLMQSGRIVTQRGFIRGLGNFRLPSSSDAPGVVGTSSLDALDEEAERVGEPGDSSRNMRKASSIENV